MKNVKAKTNEQVAMQVSANSIAVNLMLSIFKLIAGLLASSGAMISDAIHSASDVFSTIIVIIVNPTLSSILATQMPCRSCRSGA